MGRPRICHSDAERQAAYRRRRAARLEVALGVGALERIRQLESELAAADRRAEAATAAVAALRQELAQRVRDAQRAEDRIQHLERLGAAIWAQLQLERSRADLEPERTSRDGLLGLNRAQRRAADRQHRRHRPA